MKGGQIRKLGVAGSLGRRGAGEVGMVAGGRGQCVCKYPSSRPGPTANYMSHLDRATLGLRVFSSTADVRNQHLHFNKTPW